MLKKNTSLFIVIGFILLAVLGIVAKLLANPGMFLKGVFIFAIVGVIVYVVIRNLYQPSQARHEHQAFKKAAKQSKKKYSQRGQKTSPQTKIRGNIYSLNKKKNRTNNGTHLRVIEGKKGKKKNRASF